MNVILQKADGGQTVVQVDQLKTSDGQDLSFNDAGQLLDAKRPSIPRHAQPEHDTASDIHSSPARETKAEEQDQKEYERNKRRSER